MATILQYRPRAMTSRDDRAKGPAQILIFTGIRYERLAGQRGNAQPGPRQSMTRGRRKPETAQG